MLRPGAELRFYEHVVARCRPKRLLLDLIDPKRHLAGGRRRLPPGPGHHRAIVRGGFDIQQIERFGFSAQRFQPLIPHILGRARRA